MVIEDFKTLSSPERWYELMEYGEYLAYFKGRDYGYKVYALHNFFVEVVIDLLTYREVNQNVYTDAGFMDRYVNVPKRTRSGKQR